MNCFDCKNYREDSTCKVGEGVVCPHYEEIKQTPHDTQKISCQGITGCGILILLALIFAPKTIIKIVTLIVGIWK